MIDSKFRKNDNGFVCKRCKADIKPLGYTSRDHCPICLTSIHIDINPGDRANDCLGVLTPVDIKIDNKKGYIINYKCEKCKQLHNNKAAKDDNLATLFSIMNKTYDLRLKTLLK